MEYKMFRMFCCVVARVFAKWLLTCTNKPKHLPEKYNTRVVCLLFHHYCNNIPNLQHALFIDATENKCNIMFHLFSFDLSPSV